MDKTLFEAAIGTGGRRENKKMAAAEQQKRASATRSVSVSYVWPRLVGLLHQFRSLLLFALSLHVVAAFISATVAKFYGGFVDLMLERNVTGLHQLFALCVFFEALNVFICKFSEWRLSLTLCVAFWWPQILLAVRVGARWQRYEVLRHKIQTRMNAVLVETLSYRGFFLTKLYGRQEFFLNRMTSCCQELETSYVSQYIEEFFRGWAMYRLMPPLGRATMLYVGGLLVCYCGDSVDVGAFGCDFGYPFRLDLFEVY
ncbi:hypothetical protein QOT17_023783 [Balamuthia mandrillaris]